MGSHITKPSNKSMVDRLVEHNSYIRSPLVEGVFRAVDRAMYFDLEEGEAIDPYEDDPWRRGNLHISAPCIYAKVVEALDLKSGLSFLNLGSGTGYLNTIVGLLIGPNGLNHGIELHADVVEYAYKRLQQFKQNSYAIDKYDFVEPVFIKGNCLNINPNSRYDRIYLGAACLPDLETFMKKLVKPNGGILVMPYENHLVRYIRVAETIWRCEKLMDVNFTLMIRQGDDETVIDMPLAQAKSLKELCRINIRQQLRDKTNSINPNLLHSDNISSRRMRKAKAERKMLRREEQRSKFNKDQHFPTDDRRPSDGSNSFSKRKSKSRRDYNEIRGCRCRRMVEELPDDIEPERETPQEPSTSSTSPTTSLTRVMTRSASRKISNLAALPSNTSTSRPTEQSSSSSSSSSSGSEDEEHDGRSNTKLTSSNDRVSSNNCARTRPFVCTMRNRPSLAIPYHRPSLANRAYDSPPPLLPLQRRIARAIDPPTSYSSSSSSSSSTSTSTSSSASSSSSSSDDSSIHELDEYDYIGRRVVLDWPGFLRIQNTGPDSRSITSDSTLSSNDDLILDDSTSENSWDSFFDNFHNNYDTMDEYGESTSSGSPIHDDHDDIIEPYDGIIDDYVEISDDGEPETVNSSALTAPNTSSSSSSSSSNEPKPNPRKSTSKSTNSNDNKRAKNATGTSSDQEPVARRLRSKRLSLNDGETTNDNSGSRVAATMRTDDRPLPSCSRNDESGHRGLDHDTDCPMYRYSSSSSRHNSQISRRRNKSSTMANNESNSRPSSSASSSLVVGANRNNNNRDHSPIIRHHHSPNSTSADFMGNPSQGLFTGRVLIATALGTTLSLAARHYHHLQPTSSRSSAGGSFRLFERRALDAMAPRGRYQQHHCHFQQMQDQRKRKRRSSSDSSSDTSGPSNGSVGQSRSGRAGRRRRCVCAAKSTVQQSATNMTPPPAAASNTSRAAAQPIAGSSLKLSPSVADNPVAITRQHRSSSQIVNSDNTHHLPSSNSTVQPDLTESRVNHNRAHQSADNNDPTDEMIRRRHQRLRRKMELRHFRGDGSSYHHYHHHRHHHSRRHHRRHHHHHHHHRHNHRHHRLNCERHNHQAAASSPSSSSTKCARCPSTKKVLEQGANQLTGANNNENKSRRRRRRKHNSSSSGNSQRKKDRRREKKRKRAFRRRGDECERYHNHISGYISQLPLPRVLHNYLNYERNSL